MKEGKLYVVERKPAVKPTPEEVAAAVAASDRQESRPDVRTEQGSIVAASQRIPENLALMIG